MPIYEYACQRCGRLVEVMQKVSEPGPAKCEACKGKMTRVMSRSSFQLKGGGWYRDLYSSSPAGGSSSEADSGSSVKSSDSEPSSGVSTKGTGGEKIAKAEGASPKKEAAAAPAPEKKSEKKAAKKAE